MIAVLTVLCVFIRAECRIDRNAEDFLRKALGSRKSKLRQMVNEDGLTPLGVASLWGCPSYLKGLVKKGCNINGLDKRNMTALCSASSAGELAVVIELLQLGADLEARCGERRGTALMEAAAAGRVEIVKRLLEAGARANAQGSDGGTALSLAAKGNYSEILELLLDAGGDQSLPGTWRETPLYAAVVQGAIEAADVLVWRGANLDRVVGGLTVLLLSAALNNTRLVRLFVEAGADVDVKADAIDGATALHFAATRGNRNMLRFLKAAGSWLDTVDNDGHTVLHIAVTAGSAPAVEEILSWRAIDVNAVTDRGETPLHIAAVNGSLRIAELLVDAGADVNAVMEAKPGEEATVLRLAAVNDKPEIVELLLRAGAEVDPSGDVLKEAARRRCRGAVKVLLQAQDWPEEVKTAVGELVGAEAGL
jgi:ankyrin repeat protein